MALLSAGFAIVAFFALGLIAIDLWTAECRRCGLKAWALLDRGCGCPKRRS